MLLIYEVVACFFFFPSTSIFVICHFSSDTRNSILQFKTCPIHSSSTRATYIVYFHTPPSSFMTINECEQTGLPILYQHVKKAIKKEASSSHEPSPYFDEVMTFEFVFIFHIIRFPWTFLPLSASTNSYAMHIHRYHTYIAVIS